MISGKAVEFFEARAITSQGAVIVRVLIEKFNSRRKAKRDCARYSSVLSIPHTQTQFISRKNQLAMTEAVDHCLISLIVEITHRVTDKN